MVVVEVEADLADRDDAGPTGERLEAGAVPRWLEVLRLVGMDADGGEDPGRRIRERGRGFRIRKCGPGHEKPRHARRPRARHQRGAICPHLQVTMAIREPRSAQPSTLNPRLLT